MAKAQFFEKLNGFITDYCAGEYNQWTPEKVSNYFQFNLGMTEPQARNLIRIKETAGGLGGKNVEIKGREMRKAVVKHLDELFRVRFVPRLNKAGVRNFEQTSVKQSMQR